MKRYITIFLIVLGICGMQSCSHFDDLNRNRYMVGETSPATFIQTITFRTQSKMLSASYSLTSQLMQYAITKSTLESQTRVYNYETTISQASTFWDLYTQKGNAESMLAEARKAGDAGLEAVALVLRTYVMQILTDVYGDVPYFRAGLMPVEPENIEVNIKYDSQKEIYTDMLLTLEKANALFKKASNFDSVFDNTYGGNVASWRKLGNTLYLRLLMRMSLKVIEEDGGMINLGDDYGSFDVREKIYDLYNAYVTNNTNYYPMLQIADDRPWVYYDSKNTAYYTPFQNQSSIVFGQIKACKTLVDVMVPRDDEGNIIIIDPRYRYYFSDSYVGVQAQMELTDVDDFLAANNVASYAASSTYGNLKTPSRYPFMNYSEPLFIFAEACAREWIPGGTPKARELFLKACEASMEEWNPDDKSPKGVATREQFLEYLDKQFVESDNPLEEIMRQKWVASFWNGVEAWSDYRRTGYPILKTNGPAAMNNKILCTRMMYPYTEPYQNGKCYSEAVNGWLGGSDDMVTDVWFASTSESKSIRRKGRQ